MVKTRSDLKAVRVSTKAPRKMPVSVSSNASNSGRYSKKYEGGNSYFPRETPSWQKEITKFFSPSTNTDGSGSSSGVNSDLECASASSTSPGNT